MIVKFSKKGFGCFKCLHLGNNGDIYVEIYDGILKFGCAEDLHKIVCFWQILTVSEKIEFFLMIICPSELEMASMEP